MILFGKSDFSLVWWFLFIINSLLEFKISIIAMLSNTVEGL